MQVASFVSRTKGDETKISAHHSDRRDPLDKATKTQKFVNFKVVPRPRRQTDLRYITPGRGHPPLERVLSVVNHGCHGGKVAIMYEPRTIISSVPCRTSIPTSPTHKHAALVCTPQQNESDVDAKTPRSVSTAEKFVSLTRSDKASNCSPNTSADGFIQQPTNVALAHAFLGDAHRANALLPHGW